MTSQYYINKINKLINNQDKILNNATVNEVMKRYPDRIPVIIKPIDNKQPEIDKHKYLVPKDIVLSQFLFIIKKRIRDLKPEEALFLFVNKTTIPKTTSTMSEIYSNYKSEDDFLYIEYSLENTFG
jgi:GABA(A) receptor-associated protein